MYYLQSGQVKFWQEAGATASATVITPNAIVAKKQSLVSISYDPVGKHTIVAVYKGTAEVADLATGKKMLVEPTDEGKPAVAVVSFTPAAQVQTIDSAPPRQSNPGLTIGVAVTAGIILAVLGYMVFYKKLKEKNTIRQLKEDTHEKTDE